MHLTSHMSKSSIDDTKGSGPCRFCRHNRTADEKKLNFCRILYVYIREYAFKHGINISFYSFVIMNFSDTFYCCCWFKCRMNISYYLDWMTPKNAHSCASCGSICNQWMNKRWGSNIVVISCADRVYSSTTMSKRMMWNAMKRWIQFMRMRIYTVS